MGIDMDSSDTKMKTYYKARAPIYDEVYAYPERQADLRLLERYLPDQFAGQHVIELAAGTGYWTQFINRTAGSILATDVTTEALDQIKQRKLSKPVETKLLDAYALGDFSQAFDAGFSGLWYSHIPKQRVKEFLNGFHQCLKPGATVLFLDNSKAQCDRLPLSYTDDHGNTYQDRVLEDKSVHRVLKNFPTEDSLIAAVGKAGRNFKYMALDNFWVFQYQLK